MASADKRRAILDAAEKLFLSGRFDRVTLDDVRVKAGVGKGTIYRYFQDKENLYAQVILSGLDEFYASLDGKLSGPGSPEEKLVVTAQALRSFHRRRHSLFRSLDTVEFRRMLKKRAVHEELRGRYGKIVELVASTIKVGVKDGRYRGDVPPLAAAGMFLALTREGLRFKKHTGSRPVPVKRVVSVFLDGVRKR